jgi:hypothetical protein
MTGAAGAGTRCAAGVEGVGHGGMDPLLASWVGKSCSLLAGEGTRRVVLYGAETGEIDGQMVPPLAYIPSFSPPFRVFVYHHTASWQLPTSLGACVEPAPSHDVITTVIH